MKRQALHSLVALALMAVTGVLVAMPIGIAEIPLRVDLESLPASLPGWSPTNRSAGDTLPPDLRAPTRVTRAYEREGRPLWATVEYYPSQDEARRAAARDLVIPSHGWSQITERRVQIPVTSAPGGQLAVNLVMLEGRAGRVGIVYWYQIAQHPLASDHWYRVELLYNGLVRGRTDGALVRMASPMETAEDPGALLVRHADFLREFYPLLLRSLPR
jgi:EpsI family protein